MARGTRGVALPAALLLAAVGAGIAAGLADVARTQAVTARNRLAAATALAAADGCLARTVAALPAGWDFAAVLAGADGSAGTADDGIVAAPPGCSALAGGPPGPATPARVVVTVTADAGGGRRVVAGDVRRATRPGPQALIWLADPAALGPIAGTLELSGRDADEPSRPSLAGVAAAGDPALLDAWLAAQAAHLVVDAGPPQSAPAPPLAAVAARIAAAGGAPGSTLVAGGPPPVVRTLVAGDLAITSPLAGAGVLVVGGRLDIDAAFDFNGVVVALGGIRVGPAGSLRIAGALWLGRGGAGQPALAVDGTAQITARRAALDDADALLPLPRLAVVHGTRDTS